LVEILAGNWKACLGNAAKEAATDSVSKFINDILKSKNKMFSIMKQEG